MVQQLEVITSIIKQGETEPEKKKKKSTRLSLPSPEHNRVEEIPFTRMTSEGTRTLPIRNMTHQCFAI